MRAEGREANISLTAGTEAATGRADHLCSIEQGFEELPRAHAIGRSHPDVGGILTTVALIAQSLEDGEHAGGILHVVVDGFAHLCLAFGRIGGLGSALGDVAGAIELRALAAEPQLMQRDALAFESGHADLLRHHRVSTAHTREPGGLGERAELNSTPFRPTNLVDAMRDVRVLDVGFVGGVEEDESIVLQRVVHPLSQFLLGDDGTRGVVGIAEVDDFDGTSLGDFGHEAILRRDGHEAHIGPVAVAVSATTSDHHV